MDSQIFKHRVSRALLHRMMISIVGLMLLTPILAACNTPAPLQFVPVNLGIPAQALNSPVVGPITGCHKIAYAYHL